MSRSKQYFFNSSHRHRDRKGVSDYVPAATLAGRDSFTRRLLRLHRKGLIKRQIHGVYGVTGNFTFES